VRAAKQTSKAGMSSRKIFVSVSLEGVDKSQKKLWKPLSMGKILHI